MNEATMMVPLLPNGIRIFNATSHPILFWDETWEGGPVSVPPHAHIRANVVEEQAAQSPPAEGIELVSPQFRGTDEGANIIRYVRENIIDNSREPVVIVGSIIAAQAYPNLVLGIVICDGYENLPPAQRRYRADKFSTF